MACVKFNKLKLYKKKNGDKDPRFDTSEASVPNSMVSDIFDGSTQAIREFLDNVVVNKNTKSKFNFNRLKNPKNNPLVNKDGPGLIPRAIAMRHVFNSIKENENIADKIGLSSKEIETLRENGLINISALNLAHIIGRDIATSQGLVANKGSQKQLVHVYEQIGQKALDDLESMGFITSGKGSVVNNRLRTNSGKEYKNNISIIKNMPLYKINLEAIDPSIKITKSKDAITGRTSLRYPTAILRYVGKEPSLLEDQGGYMYAEHERLYSAVETGRHISMMKIPSNLQLPDIGKKTEEEISEFFPDSAIRVSNFEKDVTRQMYEHPLFVDKRLDDIFDYLSAIVGTESYANMVRDMGLTDRQAEMIFGVTKTDLFDTIESNSGRTLSKSVPISDFLESRDALKDQELHFRVDIARNARMHLFASVLNYQADKHFSRHVLTAGEYTIDINSEAYDHLLRGIEDQSSLPEELITGEKKDPHLDSMLRSYNRAFVTKDGADTLEDQKNLLELLAKRGIKVGSGAEARTITGNSAWELLSILNGISSVRNQVDGKVTSTYMTKPDATTSGGLITLMQLAGIYPEVDEMLSDLGLAKDGFGEYKASLKDFYAIVGDYFKKADDNVKNNEGFKELQGKQGPVIDKLSYLVNMSSQAPKKDHTGSFEDARDFYKYPTMKFVYKQSRNGNINDNSKEMAIGFLESMRTDEDVAYLLDNIITDEIFSKANAGSSPEDIRSIPGIVKLVSKGFNDVSTEMYNALDEKLTKASDGVLAKHNATMERGYKLLEDVTNGNASKIKIQSPVDEDATMKKLKKENFSKFLQVYGIPLTKSFETIQGDNTILKKEFANMPSMFVVPQHMIDSMILKKALKATYKQLKNEAGIPQGSMGIHDALEASPAFNVVLEKNYRIAFVETNRNYDVMNALIESIESNPLSESNKIDLAALKAEVAGNVSKKREALSEINTQNIFGFDKGFSEPTEVMENGKLRLKRVEGHNRETREPLKTEDKKPTEDTIPVVEETKEIKEPFKPDQDAPPKKNNRNYYNVKGPGNPAKREEATEATEEKGMEILNPILRDTTPIASNIEQTEEQQSDSQKILKELFDFDVSKYRNDLPKEALTRVLFFLKYFPHAVITQDVATSFYGNDRIFWNKNDSSIFDKNKPMTELEQLEGFAHEVDHFFMDQYLEDNLVDGVYSSQEVSLLEDFIQDARVSNIGSIKKAINKATPNKDGKISLDVITRRIAYALYGTSLPVAGTKEEFNKILDSNPEISARDMLEFSAITQNESGFQDLILGNLDKKEKRFLTRLWEKIKALTYRAIGKDIKENNLSTELFDKTIKKIAVEGMKGRIKNNETTIQRLRREHKGKAPTHTERIAREEEDTTETSPIEEALEYRAYKGINNSKSDPLTDTMTYFNKQSADIIKNIFYYDEGKTNAYSLLSTGHSKLQANFPAYEKMAGYISQTYEGNELLQQLVHYVNADTFDRKKERNQFMTISSNAEQNAIKVSNDESRKLDLAVQEYTKSDKGKIRELYHTWANSSIFSLINNNMLSQIAEGNLSVDKAISDLEEKLDTGKIEQAKDLSILILDGKVSSERPTVYNSNELNMRDEVKEDFDALVSLYSLESSKSESSIHKLFKNDIELYNSLVHWNHVMNNMNKIAREDVPSTLGENNNFRHNIIGDHFEVRKEFAVVTRRDLRAGSYSENAGWKIMRHPTAEAFGIAYRDVEDLSSQTGVGTNVNYTQSDIMVPRKYSSQVNRVRDNAVESYIGKEKRFKIILTTEEKRSIGLIENPSHPLVSSFTKSSLIQDTKVIRRELLKDSFTYQLSTSGEQEVLEDIISNKKKDNPWFIKLGKGVIFDDLHQSVKNKYKIITEPISSVEGFKYDVSMVRKDISPWLMGYREPTAFEDNPELRRIADVVKKLVSLMKTHWILNNPAKIAADIMSNETILLAKNVSIPKQWDYAKKIIPQLKDLEHLRGKVLQAKIKYLGDDTTANKNRFETLKNKLSKHPLAFAMNNGMIQSLSTDIVMKNYNTISGLQKDMEKLVGSFMRDDQGNLTNFAEKIMNFSQAGPGFEDLMNKLASLAPEDQHRAREILSDSADRVAAMKNDREIERYLTQFLGSPDSEITRLGSAATQYADVIPRIILYMHLKDKGDSEQDAVQEALDTFIDYRLNMPKELKVLSDFGLVLFPSFWMRIQRVILHMSVNNSASIAGGLAVSAMFGQMMELEGGTPHIFNANVINRTLNGDLMNFEYPLLDMVLPTRIVN